MLHDQKIDKMISPGPNQTNEDIDCNSALNPVKVYISLLENSPDNQESQGGQKKYGKCYICNFNRYGLIDYTDPMNQEGHDGQCNNGDLDMRPGCDRKHPGNQDHGEDYSVHDLANPGYPERK